MDSNNNQEQGKVFGSAAGGRFQFENASVELTPEQVAEQERQKVLAEERQKKIKIAIYVAFGVVVAGILTIVAVTIVNNVRKANVAKEEGAFGVIDRGRYDEIAYWASHFTNNPEIAEKNYQEVSDMLKELEKYKLADSETYQTLLRIQNALISNNKIHLDEYRSNFEKSFQFVKDDKITAWQTLDSARGFFIVNGQKENAVWAIEQLLERNANGLYGQTFSPDEEIPELEEELAQLKAELNPPQDTDDGDNTEDEEDHEDGEEI
ncbi:MAG: hypothetical protein LBM97_02270 [Candidatus Nomurabacteria bacterium]|jgi:hypothetical protein|nr:hypothetical protein [Candidatus Nomurabacteria bacterium]